MTLHRSVFAHSEEQWPTLGERALHGLAGRIVTEVSPYSEADPVALLIHVLVAFGNLIGPRPHYKVEYTRHSLRLFAALVGETSKARKGAAWSTPRFLLSRVDPQWARNCIVQGGVSSGEGILNAVRDRISELQPVRRAGRVTGYDSVIRDHGVSDKRLLLVEEEFSQALKVMTRDGNIVSPILRQAWDSGNLRPLTKNNPIRTTGAHISIIAHITQAELKQTMTKTDQANGFGNRFLWLVVRRSKVIPDPTRLPSELSRSLVAELKAAVKFSESVNELTRSKRAGRYWHKIYGRLSEGLPGLSGAMLARAEAQVMRIACLYALFDQSAIVRLVHLKAALSLWDYCEASTRWVFGTSIGHPLADRIWSDLRTRGPLTATQINDSLDGHESKDAIGEAFALLERYALVSRRRITTGGRRRTVWKSR